MVYEDQWKSRLEKFLQIDFKDDNLPKKRGRKKYFHRSAHWTPREIHCTVKFFNGHTYQSVFFKDLLQAKHSVVISGTFYQK